MGSIVALDEYKRTLGKQTDRTPKFERPEIRGSEIWGRDYTEIEAIVYGLLTVRNILAFHTGGKNKNFDQLCLDALDAAYMIQDVGPARLKGAIKPLKEWILDEITEDNKRDMSWALVLCDLIEKSPTK